MSKKVETKEDWIDSKLKAVAKSNGVSLEEITTKYKEKIKELIEKKMANAEKIAIYALMNEYRKTRVKAELAASGDKRFKKREIVIVKGIITGDSGVFDKANMIRNIAKRYIDKNGVQAAIEKQLIDGEGKVLDTREKIFGRENPKRLEPLDENCHLRSRTLYGFFCIDNKWKRGSIQTNDNRLALGWSKVKFYTPCQVPASIENGEDSNDFLSLRSSSAEETLSIFKGVKEDIDVKAVIDEVLEKEWTEIKDVERHYENTKEAWNRQIFVKGVVAWIGLDRVTPIGTIKMGLMNPDDDSELVVVHIPTFMSVDFGELSEIYVFGKTRREKYYNEEHNLVDGDVTIMATDLFPTVATPRENKDNKPQEEVEIEGWVD